MADFQKETFEGVREGIQLVASAVREVPTMVKDCKIAEEDLDKLVQLAEIFAHPLQLVFRIGHNLIVDGVEIYT